MDPVYNSKFTCEKTVLEEAEWLAQSTGITQRIEWRSDHFVVVENHKPIVGRLIEIIEKVGS